MLTLNQGNTYSLTYNIKNSDNTDTDLLGTTELKYKLARKKQTAAVLEYVLTDAELSFTDSAISIEITSTALNLLEEGSYYHELWHVSASGDPRTLMSEKIAISSKLIKE
jgi:hypothetical protein